MTGRLMRYVSRIVVGHPGVVALVSLLLTVFLYSHIGRLRLGTDLTDLFGADDPHWKAISKMGKELGYGNQLFVLIEAPQGSEATEQMEEMADKLSSDMRASGMFKSARYGLSQNELLQMVRLFAWNFPAFLRADQWPEVKERLSPAQIRRTIRTSGGELVTPFSALGTDYFVTDPLGLMQVVAGASRGFSGFGSFDFNWGSGNHFFSQDHKALLIIAEPREPAVDYQFAQKIVDFTLQLAASFGADSDLKDTHLRVTPAGAYVYAEEEHKFIEDNVRLISTLSIVGNLLLCLAIYPRIPLLLLSLLPTFLGILWTTGVASFYPGEVNLISLSFIAILAGLGDDQIVHFFNRVPQEWAQTKDLASAMKDAFATTGSSILLCILTAATATSALALSSFKALAEFGFILTVGMVMMMLHTLFTVPALMLLWWRVSKPKAPETITFRFLPFLAHVGVNFVCRYPRTVTALASSAFVLSLLALPSVKMNRKIEVTLGAENPAISAQNRLSAHFGIEGSPDVLLVSGGQDEVLERAEMLTGAIEGYVKRGIIKSVFSPTTIVAASNTQAKFSRLLKDIDLNASASALESSIRNSGFRVEPFQPFIDRLRQLSHGVDPLTVDAAGRYLPAGLLDNSIRKTGDDQYVAVVAYYPADPNATQVVPDDVLASWRRQFGPFVDFSFNKINRDVQNRVLHDSRQALLWTAAGIVLIVYLCFRKIRVSLLVLLPIVFGIVVSIGILQLAGHHFSFMAITAIPLIIGIGIDNGIHLVRRYRENRSNSIRETAEASGAAIIQSNLTTIVAFAALMASSFQPLAEMGLVTALGVAMALVGGLLVVPAVIRLTELHVEIPIRLQITNKKVESNSGF